jgi:hypothetical protein
LLLVDIAIALSLVVWIVASRLKYVNVASNEKGSRNTLCRIPMAINAGGVQLNAPTLNSMNFVAISNAAGRGRSTAADYRAGS